MEKFKITKENIKQIAFELHERCDQNYVVYNVKNGNLYAYFPKHFALELGNLVIGSHDFILRLQSCRRKDEIESVCNFMKEITKEIIKWEIFEIID